MDINDLTYREIKEISCLIQRAQTETRHPYAIGEMYFIRTVTMYESGKSLAQIAPQFAISRQSLFGSFKARGVTLRSQRRYGKDTHFYRGGKKAKDSAQNKLEKAVSNGEVCRPSHCERCGMQPLCFKNGRTAIQAHHRDYLNPLEVQWLCQKCHHQEHISVSRGL